MISNIFKGIDEKVIEVPLIIRADHEEWIPTFDIWSTEVDQDTSYIDCTQNFRSKLKNYSSTEIDPKIGYYNGDNLVIYWKTLINSADLNVINEIYSGKLRATCWQRRYCTYFGTGSNMPWLHSVVIGHSEPAYVTHHINGVSVDNRRQNLHILSKREHDSINHPALDERKQMFASPKRYWYERKTLAIDQFITQLALIITDEGKAGFIAKFAEENMSLAKEILHAAKIYINLNSVKVRNSKNRELNAHLEKSYLDSYEIEKYLKRNVYKPKLTEDQLRLF